MTFCIVLDMGTNFGHTSPRFKSYISFKTKARRANVYFGVMERIVRMVIEKTENFFLFNHLP